MRLILIVAYLIHAAATAGLTALLLFGLSGRAPSSSRWRSTAWRASFAMAAGVLWPVIAAVGVVAWLADVFVGRDPFEWEDRAWTEERDVERDGED